jgi:hypothetical protein
VNCGLYFDDLTYKLDHQNIMSLYKRWHRQQPQSDYGSKNGFLRFAKNKVTLVINSLTFDPYFDVYLNIS